jgi:hypothetical protein
MAALPDLVQIHGQVKDRGVVFIGLSPEPATDAVGLQAILNAEPGVTWSIGYGAEPTVEALGVFQLPTYLVFDRSGKLVWTGHSHASMHEVLIQQLAAE